MEDAENQSRVSKLLSDVWAEREAQEAKWGVRYELDSPPEHWLAIMGEEFGEVADEILERDMWSPQRKEGEKWFTGFASRLGMAARSILENRFGSNSGGP